MNNLTVGEVRAILRDAIHRGLGPHDPIRIPGESRAEMGGVFETPIRQHYLVQRAIEINDPEKEQWLRKWVLATGKHVSGEGYEEVDRLSSHNLMPTKTLAYILNSLFRNGTRETLFYGAFFTTSWTPALTAGSNWANPALPALATELNIASYTVDGSPATARAALTFPADATDGTIATSTKTIVLATGVTGVDIEGITLNSTATYQYTGTDELLFAGTKYPTTKAGLDEASELGMKYNFVVANAS